MPHVTVDRQSLLTLLQVASTQVTSSVIGAELYELKQMFSAHELASGVVTSDQTSETIGMSLEGKVRNYVRDKWGWTIGEYIQPGFEIPDHMVDQYIDGQSPTWLMEVICRVIDNEW